jgi:hypothetical protein
MYDKWVIFRRLTFSFSLKLETFAGYNDIGMKSMATLGTDSFLKRGDVTLNSRTE